MQLEGCVALVTGAANGIGLCYVKELLRNGVKAVSIGDVDEKSGNEALNQIADEFGKGRAIFLKTDVTNATELENLFKATMETFKRLDIVINNAGILMDKLWEKMIDINVTAVCRGSLLGFQYMGKEHGHAGGTIVNIASILGLQPLDGCPIYVASKHAVVGLSRSFGTPFHLEHSGVRVLTMCPGVTDTPLISEAGRFGLDERMGREVARGLQALPAQEPINVARGMLTLIKEGANGSVWVCEGGEPAYEVDLPDRRTLRKQK